MEKDIIKFYENIKFIGNKDICKYEDEKGNLMLLPMGQLIANCQYIELEEDKYKIARLDGTLDKKEDYKKIKTTKLKDKYEITKKEKDKGTIIDAEVEVYCAWIVSNGLGLKKPYSNKEEAIKQVEKINGNILHEAKLI